MVKIKTKVSKTFYSLFGTRFTIRVATKWHTCSGCYKIIEVGEKEKEITGKKDGHYYTLYRCSSCW